MESKKILSKETFPPPLICLVCGDVARGMNFEVITCMSCKAFFRRKKESRCLLNNDCIITKQTRGACSACRLKKCFTLGMDPKVLRGTTKRAAAYINFQQQQQQTYVPQPTTISLLSKDHSTLTFDEWNILSNIVHAYDEQNIVIRIQHALQEQSSLPLKLRSKQSSTLDLVGLFYTAIQPFIERSPYFHDLPIVVRQVLIHNNLNGTGAFNSLFGALQANVFDNEAHILNCNEIYGAEYVKESERVMRRLESDTTLIKMLLIILVFSSNCSIISSEQIFSLSYTSTTSAMILTHVQDIFVVILWKYLVYKYGFIEAVRRLNRLVKNYLDLLNRVHENHSKQHAEMVNIIVEKTADSLALN
ncbi:unnamed protein product [Adineta steineri]|uniref:Nuclear receptor domain-containing protein n=1 Tax=Adineta steineri TaxID=433720 RepID=A0A813NGV9_9BILA|nr:unnamed protein product [Adineta steineri]CAF1232233.1 unnamed protein product [Adineta steineri]